MRETKRKERNGTEKGGRGESGSATRIESGKGETSEGSRKPEQKGAGKE